jgi:hypothetical protein
MEQCYTSLKMVFIFAHDAIFSLFPHYNRSFVQVLAFNCRGRTRGKMRGEKLCITCTEITNSVSYM